MSLPLLLNKIHTRNVEGWQVERDTRTGPPPSRPFPMTTPCRAGEASELHPAVYHTATQDRVQMATTLQLDAMNSDSQGSLARDWGVGGKGRG